METAIGSIRPTSWIEAETPLHALYIMQEVDRPMLAPGDVLRQAHDQRFFGCRLDHEGRDLGLA